MSGTFAGFSEDDIKKLKSGNPSTKGEDKSKTRRQVIKAKRRTDHNSFKAKSMQSQILKIIDPILEDVKLNNEEKIYNRASLNLPSVSESLLNGINSISETKCESDTIITLSSNKIEKKVINLDEFQAKQKYFEEQNRRRKELLAKALADRTKQTEEEAKRLKDIQSEFKKLDVLLSNDVAVLRHQIEITSIDFLEAQKRYHKVEKEFLDAKLNLHRKLEKKEMLTEHLCAIIEKNEERKAEKLNELMDRLTVGGKIITETIETQDNKTQLLETEVINIAKTDEKLPNT